MVFCKELFKEVILICSYISGAMIITGGSILHFNGILLTVGSIIFGLSIVAIYDLFPKRKRSISFS